MILAYHRPKSLDEAIKLIGNPDTYPLGGGTILNRPTDDKYSVVDLQELGLNKLHHVGNNLQIDACVTLESLLASDLVHSELEKAIRLEASVNIRNMATVAGTLVSCEGRSPFVTLLLALDAKVLMQPGETEVAIGNLLPLRESHLRGKLITKITIPLNIKVAFDYVSRTPADLPIVSVVVAQWSSGRTRLALGGFGPSPLLGLDGTDSTGIQLAARNSFHDATDDWASADYRMDVAATLARRCLEAINE